MPNHPNSYEGFNIQIGPGISDNNFSYDACNDPHYQYGTTPDICRTYPYNQHYNPNSDFETYNQEHLKMGSPIPSNFGVGLPWYMMKEFYGKMNSSNDYCTETSYGDDFWWDQENDLDACITWGNIPTKTNRIKLDAVQLIRYAKNPYMLRRVKKYVLNVGDAGLSSNELEENYWRMIGHVGFDYEVTQASLYTNFELAGNKEHEFKSLDSRNIFRLKKIIQLPHNEGASIPSEGEENTSPTTSFEYQDWNTEHSLQGNSNWISPNFSFDGIKYNSSYAILNKIISPLGKETTITYQDINGGSYMLPQFISGRILPSERYGYGQTKGCYGSGWGCFDVPTDPYAFQSYLVVNNITENEAGGATKCWQYTFDGPSTIDDHVPLGLDFSWDKKFKIKKGFKTTTVSGPGEGDACGGPRVIYQHHVDPLLWGKIHHTTSYDNGGYMVSDVTSTYEAVQAFEPASFRRIKNFASYEEYHDPNRPVQGMDSFDVYWGKMVDYYYAFYQNNFNSHPEYPAWIASMPIGPTDCTNGYGELTPCDCTTLQYLPEDIQACDEYMVAYNEWLSNEPPFISLGSTGDGAPLNFGLDRSNADMLAFSGLYDVPIFYESRYAQYIAGYNSTYLNSYFIKKTSDKSLSYDFGCKGSPPIETTTTYQYFDADYRGIPQSNSFAEAIQNTGAQLSWEPSFKLYKTTTAYSNLDGAKTESATIYLYDFVNAGEGANTGLLGTPNYDNKILWNLWAFDKNRSMPLETRTVTQSPGHEPINTSTYYSYKQDWVEAGETAEIIQIENPDPDDEGWPCSLGDDGTGSGSSDPSGPSGTFCGTTYIYENGVPCYYCAYGPVSSLPFAVPHPEYFGYWCFDDGTGGPGDPTGPTGTIISPIIYPTDNITSTIGEPIDFPEDEEDDPGVAAQAVHLIEGKIYLDKVYQQVEAVNSFAKDPIKLNLSNGDLDIPYEALLVQEITERNRYGQVVEEIDSKNLCTRYEYDTFRIFEYEDCQNGHAIIQSLFARDNLGLPSSVTVGCNTSDPLTSFYQYDLKNNLTAIKDPNGIELSYTYDDYQRMEEASRNGKRIQKNAYSNWDNSGGSFKNRAEQNYVESFNYTDNERGWGSRTFIDPQARQVGIMNYADDGNSGNMAGVMVEDNIFDIWGRAEKKLAPHGSNTPTVDPFNIGTAASFEFDQSPRNRVLKAAKYGLSLEGIHNVTTRYCIVTAATLAHELQAAEQSMIPTGSLFLRSRTTDEDNHPVIEYKNVLGQTVATITNDGKYATTFTYDSHGNVHVASDPNNKLSNYEYNFLGQLYKKTTPDMGKALYGYNHYGGLIVELNAEHALERKLRIYDYDAFGRMIHQGLTEDTSVGKFLKNDGQGWKADSPSYDEITDAFDNGKCVFEKDWFYTNTPIGSPASFGKGKLGGTNSYQLDGKLISQRSLGYNKDGFLDKEDNIFFHTVLGGDEDVRHTVKYPDYNFQGSNELQEVDVNSDGSTDMTYIYRYDAWNRLVAVSIATDIGKMLIAEYVYDDIKQLVKYKKYYDTFVNEDDPTDICLDEQIDEIEYAYDERFRLVLMRSKLFNYQLYYDNDIFPFSGSVHSNNWNGNINGIDAYYALENTIDYEDAYSFHKGSTSYAFEYDNVNRLIASEAKFSYGDNAYETSYTFDKVGNLTNLVRKGYLPYGDPIVQNVNDNLEYDYIPQTNLLKKVKNIGGLKSAYSYDANGNALSSSGNNMIDAKYGRSNLPWEFESLVGEEKLRNINIYNANDERIFQKTGIIKESYKDAKFYLRDVAGRELAVFTPGAEKKEWYVYGNERVAKIKENIEVTWPPRGDDPGVVTRGCEEFYDCLIEIIEKEGLASDEAIHYCFELLFDELNHGTDSDGFECVQEQTAIWATLTLEEKLLIIEYLNNNYCSLIVNYWGDIDGSLTFTPHHICLYGLTIPGILADINANGTGSSGGSSPTPSDDGEVEGPKIVKTIEILYFIHDHLGNTRILYGTRADCDNKGTLSQMRSQNEVSISLCDGEEALSSTQRSIDYEKSNSSELHIEYFSANVMDYFPYGKILRSYTTPVNGNERFKSTHHERDNSTGLDYRGARFYDSDVGRFLTTDPLAKDFASWSTYNYVLGNPIRLVDPDGRAPEDHIFYLVFQKGTEVDVNKIAQQTQTLLNNNNINLTAQVLIVDQWDHNNNPLLDNTDRLTVVGNNEFVGNAIGEDANYMSDNNLVGEHGYGVGHVSTDQLSATLEDYGGEDFEGHLVRSIVHEGVGHKGIDGAGHPDLMENAGAFRRYEKYNSSPNIMTSGRNTLWSKNANYQGSSLFLPQDISNIKKGVPDPSFNGCEWQGCANDNFSSKIKY